MPDVTALHREFLEHPFVGVVTTLRADGAPHSTVVWVDVDDEGVSFNTPYGNAKSRHLEHDPRVVLMVVDPGDPYRTLCISGAAELRDEGADDQIDNLARKYLGQFPYPFRRPGERRVTVRVSADRIETAGLDAPD